jgi:hypothetical protein
MKHLRHSGPVLLCAWLLWSQLATGGGNVSVQTFWTLLSAYPENGYSNCMSAAKTAAEKLAKVDTSPSSAVKKARFVTPEEEGLLYTGKAYQVIIDYGDGRSDVTAYRCLPDTVKPK